MTQADLAARLAVSASAVAQLEDGELAGRITLSKLTEIADALDCQLVYALVPNSSLEETVTRQARKVARKRLRYVATTMALEDQAVSTRREAEEVEQTAREIVAEGSMWREGMPVRKR
jgi:predicted DNA-binding mobile mystery protein A